MKNSNFDNLVSEISDKERQSILNQMKNSKSSDVQEFTPIDNVPQSENISIKEMLEKESLFTRFLLWVKSLFTDATPLVLYNEMKVEELSKIISKDYPGLIDNKKGIFLPLFYDRILDLKKAADFFRPYIASMDKDDGSFYVFLGSLIMPEVESDMIENVDPYKNPISENFKIEIRSELLKNMDDIFQNISRELKQQMYENVKTIEWLRQFVKLPFAHLLSCFSEVTDSVHTCPFSQIEQELKSFSKCLCSGFCITNEVLQSLFLFSVKDSKRYKKKLNIENVDDADNELESYMRKADENVRILRMFMDSVPMHSVCCVAFEDSLWQPEPFSSGEDWFIKYKASWKKIFEQKWNSWVQECKKEKLRLSLKGHFGLESFPKLPFRPWLEIGNDIKFKYELTGGFLYWYFTEKFPKSYELSLKMIQVEGDFKRKENQIAFTDTFNELIQLSVSLSVISNRLKPNGDVGSFFEKFKDEESSRTLQEQSKIEQLMRSVESDMKSVLHRFGEADRAMEQILSGVLGLIKDPKYDTLSNLSQISGRNNNVFLKTINDARLSFENVLNLIKELESIDTPQNF